MSTALVTGASRGIGRAIALQLAKSGHHILINYASNEKAARETLTEIETMGGTAELLKFDVASTSEVDEAIEQWQVNNPDQYISVLINNAGIRKDALMMWMKNEEWNDVIGISLNGFFHCTRRLVKDMMINKKGAIVNVVSLSGIKGMAGQTNYSAAKGAVIAATKALAQEVGRKNVRVNAVAPGFIATDMTDGISEKEYKKLIPLGRFGKAEEVAEAVEFLASDKAAYITGEVLSINGGIYT